MVKLNLLQLASFKECSYWYHQHGWIDPNTNNIIWSDSSFSSVVDKYFGGIVGP
jgi:hypothetical protein